MSERSRVSAASLAAAALPVLALATFVTFTGVTLAVAGDTLGYDFLAYHAAAQRLLDGRPLYDMSFQGAGGFGLFYYPPFFAPLILPFGLLDGSIATWAWIAGSLAAFALGVALLPVARSTRWLVVLLAGLSWPFVYAVKLGQVGPLLFLVLAVGWRWLDRPTAIGASGAIGAAVKLQPGLVLAWALVTRRWRAATIGVAMLVALAVAATLLAGPAAWADFVTLIGRVGDPIETERNLTPGAVAFQLGAPGSVAAALQVAAMAVVVVVWLFACMRGSPVSSYLVTVVASQLLSPILWDHYAMLLLLPVAWLWERGHRWAAGVPLATSTMLIGITPGWIYPLAFAIVLLAVVAAGTMPPGRRSVATAAADA